MNSQSVLPSPEIPFAAKRPAPMSIELTALVTLSFGLLSEQAAAAKAAGCEGGGFSVVLPGGTVSGVPETVVPASSVGASFLVQGKFVVFEVDAPTLGIRNYTLTGAPNPQDMTGGVPTTIFASKAPNHRGLVLNGNLTATLDGPDILIERSGPGLDMKIQAKNCPQGGIFQMEPSRADGSTPISPMSWRLGCSISTTPTSETSPLCRCAQHRTSLRPATPCRSRHGTISPTINRPSSSAVIARRSPPASANSAVCRYGV